MEISAGVSVQHLNGLISALGEDQVAETLGIDHESLRSLVAGEYELDDEARDLVMVACSVLADTAGWDVEDMQSEMVDTTIDPVQGDVPPSGLALDLNRDGVPDVMLPPVPQIARPGGSWSDLQRRKRRSMWNSLAMAKMVRFQVDMPLRDQLAALALEVKIELALITYFNESIPDAGENWDGRRKYREIDTRLKRLRWVNRELRKEYGGLKGAWNWLLGRGLPTGKELYSKMVDEADDMIMAMEEGREVDILQEVMKYSGLDAEEH